MRILQQFGLGLLLALSFSGHADVREITENINGFKVHFVDIGRGTQMAATFLTPHGTLDDAGDKMGLAHLVEHLHFTGSYKLPGYHTYDATLKPAGVGHNAHTADDLTFFFVHGPQEKADLIISTEFASLGGLELKRNVFVQERKVVINEIVQEKNLQDTAVSRMMALAKLLPPTHPWSYARLGDSRGLRGMGVRDARDFYVRNYNTDEVTVAVVGNFSDPAELERVRELTRQNLHTFTDVPAQKANKEPISLFSPGAPESSRQLFLQSQQLTNATFVLEADTEATASVNLLIDYLNLSTPGSLKSRLKNEYGWINDMGVYTQTMNGKTQFNLIFDLTDSGYAHAGELQSKVFAALLDLQKIDPTVLEVLKERRLKQLEKASRSVDKFISVYEKMMRAGTTYAQTVADIRATTVDDMKKLIPLFRPDHGLYQIMGPSLDGVKLTYDRKFKRRFALFDNSVNVARSWTEWKHGSTGEFVPRLVPVDLGQRPVGAAETVWKQTPGEPALTPDRAVLDLRQDLPDTSAEVSLTVAPGSQEDALALDLRVAAFMDAHEGELAYLTLKYNVNIGAGREGHRLFFRASGEDGNSVSALHWMLNAFAGYQPTTAAIETARQRGLSDLKYEYAGKFSALLAEEEAKQFVDPLEISMSRQMELLKTIDASTVPAISQAVISAANKEVILVGNLTSADYESLRIAASVIAPMPLNAATQTRLNSRWSAIPETASENAQAYEMGRSGSAYGIVRMYAGPRPDDFRNAAAYGVMAATLGQRVKHVNRGDGGLGYIHEAYSQPIGRESLMLTLLGQTEGAANVRLTQEGWERVMQMWRSGEITDDEIDSARIGMLNRMSEEPTSAEQFLGEYHRFGGSRQDARARLNLLAELKTLTVPEIRAVADKYIMTQPSPSYIQWTLGNCSKLLEAGQ